MKRRLDAHVTMQKVVPNVTQSYRDLWKIPKEHQSVGFMSCDNEDVMWLAMDDATKKPESQRYMQRRFTEEWNIPGVSSEERSRRLFPEKPYRM